MIVELAGLEIFGYHGVGEDERRDGQLFLFDVRLEVGDRGSSDRLGEAVDYEDVARAIKEVSDGERFDLLEALATRAADVLVERFRPERLRLRVRKPQARPAGLTVEHSAVTVERP